MYRAQPLEPLLDLVERRRYRQDLRRIKWSGPRLVVICHDIKRTKDPRGGVPCAATRAILGVDWGVSRTRESRPNQTGCVASGGYQLVHKLGERAKWERTTRGG